MITIDIRPCEPHRAFHALLVVSGLRRPPLSTRFTIMARHEGKPRYVGTSGWDEKFAECRELAGGWDAEQKVLWLLLGPEVIELLDRRPFNFTLLQTGEQITELAMPASILLPGPDGLPPLEESHDKGVVALLPVPLTTPIADLRAAASARSLFQDPEPPTAEPAAAGAHAPPPRKDPSVKPVVVGIGLCLTAVLGVGFLLSGHGAAPTPPVKAAAVPALVASVQRPLPAPAAAPQPVAAPEAVATPSPRIVAEPAPTVVAEPPPAPISFKDEEPAPPPMVIPAPLPAPAPIAESADTTAALQEALAQAGGAPLSEPAPLHLAAASPAVEAACGEPPNPASIPAILESATPEHAHCIVLGWIASGRTDEAVAALSSLRRAGYVPAMLELAKLYDPLSRHSSPPPAPEFARDEYRRVIQRAGNNPVGQEAQHRLDALQDG